MKAQLTKLLVKDMHFTIRLAVFILSILTFILFAGGYLSLQGVLSVLAGNGFTPTVNCTQHVAITSISSLYAGKYQTAIDKQGTAGTCLRLNDLKVLHNGTYEADGDIHVSVVNKLGQELEIEITPLSQAVWNVTVPPTNSSINIIGIYYCDLIHSNQAWHSSGLGAPFGSCAEIHPVYAWSLNSTAIRGNFIYYNESQSQFPGD